MHKKYNAKIAGMGHYHPSKILNNYDLEKIVDTTDEWIRTRTGMFERHIAADDEASSDLALKASEKAIQAAGIRAKDIDLIIVGTVTPDHAFPSTGCILQHKLGIKNDCPAFDLSAGCTGFIYAADIARQYIENGVYQNILVVAVEILTRIVNWKDRNTCVLFGDAAGAAIISRAERSDISHFFDSVIYADGAYGDLLIQQAGGSKYPASKSTIRKNQHTIYMEGNKIFKLAIKSMASACEVVMKRNNLDIKDVDWLIPHQANLRIIEGVGKKLKVDENKVIINIEKYGNTSASTIPCALSEAIEINQIRRGDTVMTVAFGAGLTSGSMIFRY